MTADEARRLIHQSRLHVRPALAAPGSRARCGPRGPLPLRGSPPTRSRASEDPTPCHDRPPKTTARPGRLRRPGLAVSSPASTPCSTRDAAIGARSWTSHASRGKPRNGTGAAPGSSTRLSASPSPCAAKRDGAGHTAKARERLPRRR